MPTGKCEESVGVGKSSFCNYHSEMIDSSKNHQELLNFNKERAGYLDGLKVPFHILLFVARGKPVITQWRHWTVP